MSYDRLDLLPTTGYVILDLAMWSVVTVLGTLEILKRFGIVVGKNGRSLTRSPVKLSDLDVQAWEDKIRHEMRDEFDAFTRRTSEYQTRVLDRLEQLSLTVSEIATVLRERGKG